MAPEATLSKSNQPPRPSGHRKGIVSMKSQITYGICLIALLLGSLAPVRPTKMTSVGTITDSESDGRDPVKPVLSLAGFTAVEKELLEAEPTFDIKIIRPLQIKLARTENGFAFARQKPHLRTAISDLAVVQNANTIELATKLTKAVDAVYPKAALAALLRCKSLGADDARIGLPAALRYNVLRQPIPVPKDICEPSEEVEFCRIKKVACPQFDQSILLSPDAGWLVDARGTPVWQFLGSLPDSKKIDASRFLTDGTKNFQSAMLIVGNEIPAVCNPLLLHWIYQDALAALRWAAAISDEAKRNVLIEVVGFQIGSVRPEVASTAVEQCQEIEFLKGMVRGMALRNPEESLDLFKQLQISDNDMAGFILTQMAYIDPLRAAKENSNLLPGGQPKMINRRGEALHFAIAKGLLQNETTSEEITGWVHSLNGAAKSMAASTTARLAAICGRKDVIDAMMRSIKTESLESARVTMELILGSNPQYIDDFVKAGHGTREEIDVIAAEQNYRGVD